VSDLTYDKLMATMRDVMASAPPPRSSLFDFLKPSRLMGMDVYVEPDVPKIQLREITLSDGTPLVSKEFRDEYNAWLIARFGFREGLCRDKVYLLGNYGVMVGKHQLAAITNLTA
jgi:hypothetical protein